MTTSTPAQAATQQAIELPAGTRLLRAADEAAIRAAARAAHARGELEGVSHHLLEESLDRLIDEPRLAAVVEDEGRVAGWVAPLQDELTVDLPFRRRGHGRQLVEAGRVLAGELGLPSLRLWVPRWPGPEAFAHACGLRERPPIWQLVQEGDTPWTPPAFPDDVITRRIRPEADVPAFVALVNEIFLDHPWPLVLDEGDVHQVNAQPGFDPSMILLVALAGDPDRLVGFCRVGCFTDDDGVSAGEVKLLGVRREGRGRGLGRELTRWGVDDLRRRGVDRIYIVVEDLNAGALAMYEDEGFRRHVEWPHWTVPLPG
jgi:mycothiol synthase